MYPDQGLSKVWLGVAKHTIHHNLDLVFRTPKLIEEEKRTDRVSGFVTEPRALLRDDCHDLHRTQRTWCQFCETTARAQLSVSELVMLVYVDV